MYSQRTCIFLCQWHFYLNSVFLGGFAEINVSPALKQQRNLLHAFVEKVMLRSFPWGHEPSEMSKHIAQDIQRKEFRCNGIRILLCNSYIIYRLNYRYSTCACWLLGGNLSFRCFSISEAAGKYPCNTETTGWLLGEAPRPSISTQPSRKELSKQKPCVFFAPNADVKGRTNHESSLALCQ